jgi:hypothetical protein
MSKRAFTPRQQTAEIVAVNAQIAALEAVLRDFDIHWGGGQIDDVVGAAWNHVHDAVMALESHRAYVELNPRVMLVGQEAELARLVSLNID